MLKACCKAPQAMEAAEKKLVAEEAVKAELCRDLSELVAQSADAQLVSHRPQAALLKGLPAFIRRAVVSARAIM